MAARRPRRPVSLAPDLQTCSLLVLAALGLGFVLYWFKAVLIPFTLALGLQVLLGPAVDALEDRLRLKRPLAVALVFLGAAALLLALGLWAAASVQSFLKGLRDYQEVLQDAAQRWDAWLQERRLPNSRGLLAQAAAGLPLFAWAQSLSSGVLDLLFGCVLTGLFLAFLLGGRTRRSPNGLWSEVSGQVRKYLALKLLLSVLTGVLSGIILFWLDVDLAVLFGLLAFLLNFIPNIGSIIAVLLPLPLVLLRSGWSMDLLLVIVLPGAVQFSVGNVLEPRCLGRTLGLHPVAVLLSLLLWGALWGPAGMLLAVPMTSVVKLLLERSLRLAPWARWLEGDFVRA
jgi:AI-2 transport protein TqsA